MNQIAVLNSAYHALKSSSSSQKLLIAAYKPKRSIFSIFQYLVTILAVVMGLLWLIGNGENYVYIASALVASVTLLFTSQALLKMTYRDTYIKYNLDESSLFDQRLILRYSFFKSNLDKLEYSRESLESALNALSAQLDLRRKETIFKHPLAVASIVGFISLLYIPLYDRANEEGRYVIDFFIEHSPLVLFVFVLILSFAAVTDGLVSTFKRKSELELYLKWYLSEVRENT